MGRISGCLLNGPKLSNSVSQWIVNLQKGDADAAQRLWDRYFPELVEFARKRLPLEAATGRPAE